MFLTSLAVVNDCCEQRVSWRHWTHGQARQCRETRSNRRALDGFHPTNLVLWTLRMRLAHTPHHLNPCLRAGRPGKEGPTGAPGIKVQDIHLFCHVKGILHHWTADCRRARARDRKATRGPQGRKESAGRSARAARRCEHPATIRLRSPCPRRREGPADPGEPPGSVGRVRRARTASRGPRASRGTTASPASRDRWAGTAPVTPPPPMGSPR